MIESPPKSRRTAAPLSHIDATMPSKIAIVAVKRTYVVGTPKTSQRASLNVHRLRVLRTMTECEVSECEMGECAMSG